MSFDPLAGCRGVVREPPRRLFGSCGVSRDHWIPQESSGSTLIPHMVSKNAHIPWCEYFRVSMDHLMDFMNQGITKAITIV